MSNMTNTDPSDTTDKEHKPIIAYVEEHKPTDSMLHPEYVLPEEITADSVGLDMSRALEEILMMYLRECDCKEDVQEILRGAESVSFYLSQSLTALGAATESDSFDLQQIRGMNLRNTLYTFEATDTDE